MNNEIQVYTDVSKTSDGIGCAFLLVGQNVEKVSKLNPNHSILTGEAIAIVKAIKMHKSDNQ